MKPISILLLMLKVQAAFLATQGPDIHAEFLGNGNPTLKITANSSCENITTDKIQVDFYRCSISGSPLHPASVSGVCTKEGAMICLSDDLKDEQCFTLMTTVNKNWTSSLEINLKNISFFDRNRIIPTDWEHQGNTSTLKIKHIPGVSSYELKLEPPKDTNCSTIVLKSEVGRLDFYSTFTADWSQNFVPGCKYTTKLYVKNDCNKNVHIHRDLEELSWNPKRKKLTEDTVTTKAWTILAMSAVFFVVLVIALILTFTPSKRRQQQSLSPEGTANQMEKGSLPTSSLPTVLLVYSPCLHQHMAALSIQLQNLTGLKIEDLYAVGDQDKINDPTVWFTRRLMDINTRFVLAVSTPSSSFTQNNCSENRKQGGVYHFLFDHFLQHLQSSNLAYDYTRLHHVRVEKQTDNDLSNVTSGRLYLLPAHLNQLAINLTLPVPMSSTDKSSPSYEE